MNSRERGARPPWTDWNEPTLGVRDDCGRAEVRAREGCAFRGRLFEAEELDFRLERDAISFQYLPLNEFDQ